jgi:ketosteroid isomerase-like protein
MARHNDVETWVEHFTAAWATREPEAFEPLFHPDATIGHPTSTRPLRGADLPAHNRRFYRALPDLRWERMAWATRGDVALIEFSCHGTYQGVPVEWQGTDRFHLEDGRVHDAVAYFDTLPLWAALDPTMARGSILDAVDPGHSQG